MHPVEPAASHNNSWPNVDLCTAWLHQQCSPTTPCCCRPPRRRPPPTQPGGAGPGRGSWAPPALARPLRDLAPPVHGNTNTQSPPAAWCTPQHSCPGCVSTLTGWVTDGVQQRPALQPHTAAATEIQADIDPLVLHGDDIWPGNLRASLQALGNTSSTSLLTHKQADTVREEHWHTGRAGLPAQSIQTLRLRTPLRCWHPATTSIITTTFTWT